MASLKWLEINKAKIIIPRKNYLVLNGESEWNKMKLNKITYQGGNKTYLFIDQEGREHIDLIHYIDIEKLLK